MLAAGGRLPKDDRGHEDDERALFERAMAGVRPLPPGPARVPLPPAPKAPTRAERPRAMSSAVPLVPHGVDGPLLEPEWIGELVTARAPGVDKRVMKQLQRGELDPEATVDLHGMKAPDAERRLESFLAGAQAASRRVLLVLCGRGLHSGEAGAVIRTRVVSALAEGRMRGLVLAFTSAPPHRGGAGALMVLLRRPRGVTG